ncbi:MAG: histidine kinase [Bacteroidetes bacterium]|nr:histidine kinase [Bacteroidota bacterium]MBU1116303.1 histidine kinase [Bacteroidota bacterium]MBU1797320.1 histidine kinase [Bacteroidota bacterium]
MNNMLLDKKKLLIILLSWEIAGIVVALIMSIPKPSFHTFLDQIYICLTFTNSIAIFSAILLLIYRKFILNRDTSIYILIPLVIISVTATIAISLKFAVFCGSYFCGLDTYEVNVWHLFIISINIIIITSFSVICILYFLHLKASSNLETKLQENEQLKRLQIESKLSILQSKVNPHFLFNTLNTMMGMVHNQPEKVEKIIFNLSDIYRKVLTLPDNALIKLEDELQLITEYLEIEKTRMGERLSYEIIVDENLAGTQFPPLILQILVENAIIHGLSPQKEGGKIEINIQPDGDCYVINVKDNGVGIKQNYRGSGFGLYNIEQRLKLIYSGKAVFEILPCETGGTLITLKLPYAN